MDLNPKSVHLGRLCSRAVGSSGSEIPEGELSSNFPCRYFDKTAYFNQILWEIGETEIIQ